MHSSAVTGLESPVRFHPFRPLFAAQSSLTIHPSAAALLRAIADKLIPGIPEGTRIAILQQTKLTDDDGDEDSRQARKAEASVLQEVIDRATARDTIEQEIKG